MCRVQYPNLTKVNIVPYLLHIYVMDMITYMYMFIIKDILMYLLNKMYLLKEKQKPIWSGKMTHKREKEKKETVNRPAIIKDFKPDFWLSKYIWPLSYINCFV